MKILFLKGDLDKWNIKHIIKELESWLNIEILSTLSTNSTHSTLSTNDYFNLLKDIVKPIGLELYGEEDFKKKKRSIKGGFMV